MVSFKVHLIASSVVYVTMFQENAYKITVWMLLSWMKFSVESKRDEYVMQPLFFFFFFFFHGGQIINGIPLNNHGTFELVILLFVSNIG